MDIERPDHLRTYLIETKRIQPNEQPRFRVLAGGISNRTVLVERANGEAWVLKQALEKLRVPVDWFSSPTRIHREAEGLRWLARLVPSGTTATLIFEDHDHHLLAMEAVPEPHTNWKTLLLAGNLQIAHVTQFGTLLATIHAQGYTQREAVSAAFADRSFFESLRLEPYYLYTAEQVPAAADFLHRLVNDTRQRILTLVHGDYSPKNVLIHQNRLVLLDHEVIHLGDPAFDVGFSLTHFLSKAHHLREYRQPFTQASRHYWHTYMQTLGQFDWNQSNWLADFETYAIRHTLACLLARVAGRSALEYMTDTTRNRQRDVVTALITHTPTTMSALITQFIERLSAYAHH